MIQKSAKDADILHSWYQKIERLSTDFYIKMELEVFIQSFIMEIKYYPLHVVCNSSGLVTQNTIPMLLFGRPTVAQGVNESQLNFH